MLALNLKEVDKGLQTTIEFKPNDRKEGLKRVIGRYFKYKNRIK